MTITTVYPGVLESADWTCFDTVMAAKSRGVKDIVAKVGIIDTSSHHPRFLLNAHASAIHPGFTSVLPVRAHSISPDVRILGCVISSLPSICTCAF